MSTDGKSPASIGANPSCRKHLHIWSTKTATQYSAEYSPRTPKPSVTPTVTPAPPRTEKTMTSKTFKNRVSVRDAGSVLEIAHTPAGIRITVREEDRIVSGWFNPVQGAGISLAILEAAGYKEHSEANLGSSELLASYGLTKLRQAVQAQEREESEARELAELEAEALELCNAAIRQEGYVIHDSFSQIPTPDLWLAVARRARELNKEATNGR